MDRQATGAGTRDPQRPARDAGTLSDQARAIFDAAVGAADPYQAVRSKLAMEGGELVVEGLSGRQRVAVPEPGQGRVIVIGAGKGSAPMAQALEELLGERIDVGLVCVKDGHTCPLERVELVEAAHPVPDQRGVAAAQRILELVQGAEAGDLVVAALSGGGSALLTLPAPGVDLDDLRTTTDLLLSCGAGIGEINALRKHLSQVKGGRLAAAAHPAAVVNLMLSDVVGDRIDVIASGPFSADPSSFQDAREIVTRYGLADRLPKAVLRVLERGCDGQLPDTPKPGSASLEKVVHAVVGSNRLSLDAAAGRARELGFAPLVLSSQIEGEAREVARVLAAIAKECRLTETPLAPPACILCGGETTVTLRGGGRGGRNQELALALALELAGWDGIVGLSGGTDGTDGPTDAAGAVASAETLAVADRAGLDARRYLDANDSYAFFDGIGGLIRTGPTRTNVMDVQLLLIA